MKEYIWKMNIGSVGSVSRVQNQEIQEMKLEKIGIQVGKVILHATFRNL